MLTSESPAVHSVLLITIVVWLVFEFRQSARQRPEATEADGGSRPALRIAYVVGFLGALVASHVVQPAAMGAANVVAWVGLAVMWCGIGLRVWCFQTLGRYFTFVVQTSPDQVVVTSGPYRVLRHPSYAALLLTSIGFGLVIGNWVSLAILVVALSCGVAYRITIEERALTTELGDRYTDYARSRKRLVPFVW